MTDGYLSRDRAHLAELQRKRRAGMVRVDYMPSREALAAIEAKRATLPEWGGASTNSATIDAIVCEWAAMTGIHNGEVEPPKSPGDAPEFADTYAQARMTSDAERPARAQESGELPGITAHIAGMRAGAYESGGSMPEWLADRKAQEARRQATRRVTCGAKRHRDGQPCKAKSEPGKRRCRFHGGRSTGPTSTEGKARALANLRQYRRT